MFPPAVEMTFLNIPSLRLRKIIVKDFFFSGNIFEGKKPKAIIAKCVTVTEEH
jgi:hypothetical protein